MMVLMPDILIYLLILIQGFESMRLRSGLLSVSIVNCVKT
jgi:hypothetical protein